MNKGTKKVTMQDIADIVGVSKMTISKCFQGNADISQEMKNKIMSVAKEIGYVYSKKTKTHILEIKEDMNMSTLEKIENAVVEGYKNIEEGVVEGYKNIENGVVEGFEKLTEGAVEGFKKVDNGNVEKIADKVTGAYQKIEDAVVGGFEKMTDGFVEKHLMKEGETLEEAKARIAKEQEERTAKVNSHIEVKAYNHKEAMKAQKEMIEKSIEASKNAGKR